MEHEEQYRPDDTETDPEDEAAQHEVNPADDPGPRGNEEIDSERLDRAEEDLDRTLPG